MEKDKENFQDDINDSSESENINQSAIFYISLFPPRNSDVQE